MKTYDQNGPCVHGFMLCPQCLPSSALALTRTAVLETIGHLQGLAAMAQTETQRTTAMRLAARLASVLPPVDDTPSNCPSVESQEKLDAAMKALTQLVFMARTAGGTSGRDEALCMACDQAEAVIGQKVPPCARRKPEDQVP